MSGLVVERAPESTRYVRVRDVRVPTLVYGTAWKEDETARLATMAIDAGFRGIDTANQRRHYFEAAVGEALASALAAGGLKREDVFLQTKFTYVDGQGHHEARHRAEQVLRRDGLGSSRSAVLQRTGYPLPGLLAADSQSRSAERSSSARDRVEGRQDGAAGDIPLCPSGGHECAHGDDLCGAHERGSRRLRLRAPARRGSNPRRDRRLGAARRVEPRRIPGQLHDAQVGNDHHAAEEEKDRPPARFAQAQGAQEAGTQVGSQAGQECQEAKITRKVAERQPGEILSIASSQHPPTALIAA